ncbi:MAG TPA: protein kinase [Polyangiaceae bacterium]|nr:protein kinase [Polyangiaceae bacterium]
MVVVRCGHACAVGAAQNGFAPRREGVQFLPGMAPLPRFDAAAIGPGVTLASGASARVWLAGPAASGGGGARWAVKEPHAHLLAEPAFRDGWRDEVRRSAGARHPHLVAALAYDPARAALALAYVEGVSLAALLDLGRARGERLPAGLVVRVLLDALSALEALHGSLVDGQALVHGDLGPRNLIVDVAGRASVCDLGAAGPPAERAPFRGSAAYGSPEALARGERSPALDVYGLGVVAWEALRGERLFRRATEAATLARAAEGGAGPLDAGRPELAPLAPWVAAALRPEPRDRPSAASARAALAGAHPAWHRARVGAVVSSWAAGELARRQGAGAS